MSSKKWIHPSPSRYETRRSSAHTLGSKMIPALLLVYSLIGATADIPIADRIVGGDETEIKYFPHQVSMELFLIIAWQHQCGGSILNSWFVLSAAHCVVRIPQAEMYRFRIGSSVKNDGGMTYETEKLWYHPKYTNVAKDYDLSIFKLTTEIVFSETVRPIAMVPQEQEPKLGERLSVSGWGLEDYDDKDSPSFLRSVTLVTTDRTFCDKAYDEGITQRMICTASPGQDACLGDSGGPLTNYRNELVGVVSFGFKCAAPGYPGVFVNLADKDMQAFIMDKLSS